MRFTLLSLLSLLFSSLTSLLSLLFSSLSPLLSSHFFSLCISSRPDPLKLSRIGFCHIFFYPSSPFSPSTLFMFIFLPLLSLFDPLFLPSFSLTSFIYLSIPFFLKSFLPTFCLLISFPHNSNLHHDLAVFSPRDDVCNLTASPTYELN